ncbi:HAMP domain-containing sensor histidine kinase [Rummeliibacillus suwonensis]|uniref:HAMP domain-containing sensor histidine kinase n=1 Tax=Rummeliibacillus suwonensis TaxID=1306154 RepID=UPI00289C9275|nr:HAMP domain-containing sensor histidine kinase [Rummeliibacillus suwonensis]
MQILLLNFLFLLIPFLGYFIFFDASSYRHFNLIFSIFATISVICCMLFPIQLQSGFIFDLRYIPFIIIALYWGFKSALIPYLAINICQLLIGGESIIESFLFSTVILIVMSLCNHKFLSLDIKYRILFSSMASFLSMVFYLFTLSFWAPFNHEFWVLSIYVIGTYLLVMLILVSMIERLIANIREQKLIMQSDRFQIISELSASVAHEIRNPLTATHGFLQLLSQSKSISLQEKNYVDYSLQELKRAEKIVGDFLTFSRPQYENMKDSDLKEETEYAKNILMPYAHMYNVDIQIRFHNSLHKYFDRSQMQQCFINIYKNGIEAMKERGGTLEIEVSEQKQNILIKIKDSGIGMTDEQISALGKPYYSTKKQGTGLGMVMVYNAIHKAGGTIEVESKIGKGTTFMITFPV